MTESASEPSPGASEATSAPIPGDPSPAASEPAGREPPSWEQVTQLRAEAKRHRLLKTTAEQERDQLRGRVDAQDRREIERQIGDRLQNPADFWLTAQLSDVRDEDGELDSEKLSARIDETLDQRPHWAKSAPSIPANFSSGVRKPIQKPRTIGDAFKNALNPGR